MRLRARTASIAAVFVALVFSSGLHAQPRWGRNGPMPRSGVCFFDDVDFRGQSFCVREGDTLDALPAGMNDRISSIRIIGRAEVIVFRDVRFSGPSARFATDVRDLRSQGWNDAISSARVETSSWENNWRPQWGGDREMRGEGACFYQDAGFRGQTFCVSRGGSIASLPPGFNDHISSVRVRGANVMIFMDADFRGRSTRITSDVDNLGGMWNDRISSIRVF
jgi:Peptidase inhibitor family I36